MHFGLNDLKRSDASKATNVEEEVLSLYFVASPTEKFAKKMRGERGAKEPTLFMQIASPFSASLGFGLR